jgi:metal-dependent amidase/aminoacylase/carboxypeptidase family protein
MTLPTTIHPSGLASPIDAAARAVEERVIAWRRDFHQHPELGNREIRTAAVVAEHLIGLGFNDVRTGVAHTGVVGLLKGALPGPVCWRCAPTWTPCR